MLYLASNHKQNKCKWVYDLVGVILWMSKDEFASDMSCLLQELSIKEQGKNHITQCMLMIFFDSVFVLCT